MDAVDKKLVALLLQDSRQPLSRIARQARVSREVASYRLQRLEERGVILQYATHISIRQLGFVRAAAFFALKRHKENEFKRYVEKCPFTSWSSEFSGIWNLGTDIFGRDSGEIHRNFLQLYGEFEQDIIDHRLRIYQSTYFFPEKYLGVRLAQTTRREEPYHPDEVDKRILKVLAESSRTGVVRIARDISLSGPAIARRIKKLERAGVIEKYSLHLDPAKLGMYTYSIFAANKRIEHREGLVGFLKEHPAIVFIAEYVGDPFIEFGVTVRNPYNLRPILQDIEEAYPESRIVEAFLIQKDLLSVVPPDILFEQ